MSERGVGDWLVALAYARPGLGIGEWRSPALARDWQLLARCVQVRVIGFPVREPERRASQIRSGLVGVESGDLQLALLIHREIRYDWIESYAHR